MRVTICELQDGPDDFARDWEQLVAHIKAESSDLLLLPEMPFYPWVAWTREVDAVSWQAAVAAHEVWLERLGELAPAVVGSRPVNVAGRRLNEGFVWTPEGGYRAVHTKYYLPDEERFWEARWYERGDGDFEPVQCGEARFGFLICTELWFMERARAYGKEGVHLVVNPRATEHFSVDKWLVGGRAAAVIAGAFCLSSNRGGWGAHSIEWGGQGWVVGPDGGVLGLTSREQPFVTVEIDLGEAEAAKQTYPRYVTE